MLSLNLTEVKTIAAGCCIRQTDMESFGGGAMCHMARGG